METGSKLKRQASTSEVKEPDTVKAALFAPYWLEDKPFDESKSTRMHLTWEYAIPPDGEVELALGRFVGVVAMIWLGC